jgi:AcrR family transcriptional regulator
MLPPLCQDGAVSEPTTRPYRGVGAQQRREERRAKLLQAGLDVVAEDGWAETTVRKVCARAGLTERYFYEAFDDRDGLLVALFDHVAAEVATTVVAAVQAAPHDATARARAAIGGFVDMLADDPRRAKVLLLEASSHEGLQRRRVQAITAFAHLVRDQAAEFYGVSEGAELEDAELTAHALVGGLAQLLLAWLLGDLRVSRERLTEHATALFVAAADVRSGRKGA